MHFSRQEPCLSLTQVTGTLGFRSDAEISAPPRLCKDSVNTCPLTPPNSIPMPALVRASCEFWASHSCRLLGVGLLVLPSFTSQFSLPLHRSSVTPPAYWRFLFYKVEFIRFKSSCSNCRWTYGSSVQTLTAFRAPWGSGLRKGVKGPVWVKRTQLLPRHHEPDSVPVFPYSTGSRRQQTKFDSGRYCPHHVVQALCWELSLTGRSIYWEEIFLIIVLYRSLLGWVRASCPPFWLCYWFCMVEVVPESLEV